MKGCSELVFDSRFLYGWLTGNTERVSRVASEVGFGYDRMGWSGDFRRVEVEDEGESSGRQWVVANKTRRGG